MAATREHSGTSVSMLRHLRAILLLPVMNTLLIPTVLVVGFGDAGLTPTAAAINVLCIVSGLLLVAGGLLLVVRAIALFVRHGDGTLAPWDPTRVMIIADIYRYCRNPMKSGLFLILIGEVLVLRSVALAIWALCFIAANVIYIRAFEERGLRRRFGVAYEDYCSRVPRWLPRFKASSKPPAGQSTELTA